MATERTAHVTWRGDLMSGEGRIERVGSGAFGGLDVDWPARAEEPQGGKTSPEELIAAAHASCFAMALSNVLGEGGTAPEELDVSAKVTFVPGTGITTSELEVVGTVPRIDDDAFQEAAQKAKVNCPVSQALQGNVDVKLNATLR
jgi:osmotically inducible protein OsmC